MKPGLTYMYLLMLRPFWIVQKNLYINIGKKLLRNCTYCLAQFVRRNQ